MQDDILCSANCEDAPHNMYASCRQRTILLLFETSSS